MQRVLVFKLVIALLILTSAVNGLNCPCTISGDILQCKVTASLYIVEADTCGLGSYKSISITYSGIVALSVASSSTNSISIKPDDGSDNNVVQITSLDTKAARIDIQIRLSSNQVTKALFEGSSASFSIPSTSTLSIKVTQSIASANNFRLFGNLLSSKINLARFEVIFDNGTNSGNLSFNNIISGLKNASSVIIQGNNHMLTNDQSQIQSSFIINHLSLKNLRLSDQLLYNIQNLMEYSIEQCSYDKAAKFLTSDRKYDISIIMKNNIPLNSILPNYPSTFDSLGTVSNITLIEPNLNSSSLKPINYKINTRYIILELGSYFPSDFDAWKADQLDFREMTINNIQNLNIFPSGFFSTIDPIQQATLQGRFPLTKNDICAFFGINIQPNQKIPVVILNSDKKNTNQWDNCADTYIKAINTYSIDQIKCPGDDTCDDCERWANATAQCDLISFENSCPGIINNRVNNFHYNNSHLDLFFRRRYWLTNTTYVTRPPSSQQSDAINIGAIIGAVCGLVIAIIVLGLTIFCIKRYRHKNIPQSTVLSPKDKYGYKSDDDTHLSIATSKTSKSSRYKLQKSFFPPMQPNDEIAPPLYTAPSESVGSISTYKVPSAPPAPRDSISTHATHVYETLDP